MRGSEHHAFRKARYVCRLDLPSGVCYNVSLESCVECVWTAKVVNVYAQDVYVSRHYGSCIACKCVYVCVCVCVCVCECVCVCVSACMCVCVFTCT